MLPSANNIVFSQRCCLQLTTLPPVNEVAFSRRYCRLPMTLPLADSVEMECIIKHGQFGREPWFSFLGTMASCQGSQIQGLQQRESDAYEHNIKSFRRILCISHNEHKTNKYTRQQLNSLSGRQDPLSMVKRRRLSWFGSHHPT